MVRIYRHIKEVKLIRWSKKANLKISQVINFENPFT